MRTCVIVGLGNPGKAYIETRHNIGFRVLDTFADRNQWKFGRQKETESRVARGNISGVDVILVKPWTYMNGSGFSVEKSLSLYEVLPEDICVVCDDIYLSPGRMKIKPFGGSGGHNGLRSIDARLGTQTYARLRIGVGDRIEGDLADHVLSEFSEEEKMRIPDLLQKATDALECWIFEGMESAMRLVNGYREEKISEEEPLGE